MFVMNMYRSRRVAPLVVIAAVSGCGGRTQTSGESSGEVVTIGATTTGDLTTADETSDQATPSPNPLTTGPTSPGTSPTTPPATTITPGFTTGTDTTSSQSTAPEEVVSPPHAMGCPIPDVFAHPAVGYTFSDGTTSITLQTSLGGSEWCVYGKAPPSGDDYSQWGAGFGAFIGYEDLPGVRAPFDASSLGIVGLRFQLRAKGRAVRLMLTEADSPYITSTAENFEQNAFIWGGSSLRQMYYGSYEIRFEDIELPNWSLVPPEYQRPLDASRLHSFQFMVANTPLDEYTEYSFCVSKLEWVDACGNTVASSVSAETPATSPGTPPTDVSTGPELASSTAPETSGTEPLGSSATPDSSSLPTQTSSDEPAPNSDAGVEEATTGTASSGDAG